METLFLASNPSNPPNWDFRKSDGTEWTKEENKSFERALAFYDEKTPDRWIKVAAMIPGKTVLDVVKQYKELVEDVSEIEAGRFPIPGYLTSSFSVEMVDDRNFDGCRKKASAARASDQERKKGVPWTEEEHRHFLLGLLKCGKGDWRNISRNYVFSRTPTQVASHAQKYFMRQHSGGKDKRRPSIHDVTIYNLSNSIASEIDKMPLPNQSSKLPPHQKSACTKIASVDFNQSKDGGVVAFDPTHGSLFMSSALETASNGLKVAQNLCSTSHYGAYTKPPNGVFQIQSSRHQIHG